MVIIAPKKSKGDAMLEAFIKMDKKAKEEAAKESKADKSESNSKKK